MEKFIKSILYTFLPLSFRSKIFYKQQAIFFKLQALYYVFKIRYPRIRKEGEYNMGMATRFIKFREKYTHEKYEFLRNQLINNLDEDSRETVKNYEIKVDYIFNNNLLDQNKIFTKKEKEEQKICSQELKKLLRKIKKYNFSYLSNETFYGYNGLRWIPKKQQEKIKNGICIDGGAFEGDTAIMLINNFQANEVHSFEIEPKNYNKLLETIKISKSNKIKPRFIGLSDHSGSGSTISLGTGSIIIEEDGDNNIQIDKLDNLYSPAEKISLIKLDVEGAEQKVLRGAEEIIKRDKPVLAISIYHNADDFLRIKPLIESMQPGYKFIIKKISPFTILSEVMLIATYE